MREELDTDIHVMPHHEVMGAIGAALLVRESVAETGEESRFKGFGVAGTDYKTTSFECKSCPNLCEIAQLATNGKVLARWGGRCDIWERSETEAAEPVGEVKE